MGAARIRGDHGWLARARTAFDRLLHSRPGRAGARYWVSKGNLLSGGISYYALFSVFASLAIGYTAFMSVLGDNEELRDAVLSSVDQALPGVIDDGSGSGLVRPEDLVLETDLTPASLVAGGVLVWSALRVMTALKRSIRTMFGIVAPPENIIVNRVRDVAGFLVVALGVLLSSVLGVAAGTLTQGVFDFLGIQGAAVQQLLRVLGFVVAAVVDGAVIVLLVRLTAGARPPRGDLLLGAALGATASGVLRFLGTSVVGAVGNPVLASFTAIVTLLLWVNIVARVLLLVAAFTANPPFPALADSHEEVRYRSRPNYVTFSEPATLDWEHEPITGTIVPSGADGQDGDGGQGRDTEER